MRSRVRRHFCSTSGESSFITGQTICVDGGFTAAGIMGG